MNKKSYIYNLKMMEDLKMSRDNSLYTFTEGVNEKERAGTIVDRLVKTYTTNNPQASYENAMKVILALPANKKLAETYCEDSNALL